MDTPYKVKPHFVWFDLLGEEILSIASSDATDALIKQLNKEGIVVKCVLAKDENIAKKLAFPKNPTTKISYIQ